MHHRSACRFVLVASVLACGQAAAQVNFDPRALDQLNKPAAPAATTPPAPAAPTTAAPAKAPERRAPAETTRPRRPPARAERTPAPERATPPSPAASAQAAKPAAAVPTKPASGTTVRVPDSRTTPIPAAPPANPNIPPPIVVPARPSPPPSPVAVVPTATGTATSIESGQRITFGAGSSDLNPATDAALRTMVHAAPPFNTTTFTVSSYASGSEEDQSTARRVSLARALAVRSVLITEGVASVRIYVKALGASAPTMADGPPDRVDIFVATPQGAPAGGPPPSPAPAARAK